MALKLTITSPEGLVHQGEASAVVVPALDGELGILPRHAPLVGQLGVGEVRVKPAAGGGEGRFFLAGGFVQVLRDRVTVLATRAEAVSAIDRAKAEEELRRLESEPVPPRSPSAQRAERAERIRAARARVKAVGGRRAPG